LPPFFDKGRKISELVTTVNLRIFPSSTLKLGKQVELLKAFHEHINETGKMEGFVSSQNGGLVKAFSNGLGHSNNGKLRNLSKSRLAALQPLAGRNPMLARKVIRNEKLGLNKQAKPEHTQYVVVMPIIIAALFSFAVVRFVGLGTGNKALYITGGVCLVAGMALKQLGSVRGARKRLGG
jgi:hypothetical protein